MRCGGGGEEGAGELVQGFRLEPAAACSHTVLFFFFFAFVLFVFNLCLILQVLGEPPP